jgi:peptide-methionine (R)-S-oxide reductase
MRPPDVSLADGGTNKVTRTRFLSTSAILAAALCAGGYAARALGDQSKHFEVEHSDQEWRKLLTPEQYQVLRQEGTETAFSSPLDAEKRAGVYSCAGCELALYSSKTKFDSGTGWPSFYKPLSNAIETREDDSLLETRTEVHCRRCGGHLGHVFDDGPGPTGLRYCINSAALKLQPK